MSEKEIGWWEWMQSTKDKVVNQSSEVFEFVKKDIEEFSKVVTEEASSVVSSTASSIKDKLQLDDQTSSANQMKKSVSGFLSHVAEVFTPSPDDDDEEAIMIWNQQPVTLDRLEAAKYAFCSNPSNFLREPDSEEHYESWLHSFKIESHENELPELLTENDALRHCYSALVPSQMNHNVFWHKYFYEINKLEKAEKKRQEMKKRAEATTGDAQIVWEDEDDLNDNVIITEQMQKQLLEDYEKEIQETGPPTCESDTKDTNNSDPSPNAEPSSDGIQRSSKSSTPSSRDTEDEWEKVEPEAQVSQTTSNVESSSSSKSEDWENWE